MTEIQVTEISAIGKALVEPFDPRDVKFKPQMVKNNRCLAMAYIDARLVQERLDKAVGFENWKDTYQVLSDGSVQCQLSLRLGGEWVTKEDVGSPSEQPDSGDRLKAAFSDALKRAAVKFGVGRYIYWLEPQWVDYDPVKKQIVQAPQLPDWALPAKQIDKLKPVATAAKAELAVEEAKRDDLIVDQWCVMLQANPTIDEINQSLHRIKAMRETPQKECWNRTTSYAKKAGWTWNDVTKKFEAKEKTSANTAR